MLTERLINEIGLLKLQLKSAANSNNNQPAAKQGQAARLQANQPPAKPHKQNTAKVVKLGKDEFRLLVKMLQAIGHECSFDQIQYDGHTVTYQHPKKTLVFNDISLDDNKQIINLSSLKNILADDTLKRPVWEKLKTLQE